MKKNVTKKSILNLLNGKSNDFVSKFFSKPSIVVAIYRNLPSSCREMINRCLSQNPERFYEFENENDFSQIEASKSKLEEFHILSNIDGKYFLNPVFKTTFFHSISKGIKPFFKILHPSKDIESPIKEDFFKFMEIYNFILENEIQIHKNNMITSPLNPIFKEILTKLNFQIRVVNNNQDKNISGFKFLVEPIHKQINIFLLHYFEHLTQNRAKLFKKIDSDVGFEQNLLEIFCTFNFLSSKFIYGFNNFDNYISSEVVVKILGDLATIGLVQFNFVDQTFRISLLLEGFLNNIPRDFDQFKTNIIVETDFKIYIYSEFDYIEHFISYFIRLVCKD